jgi:hypothetical protein
MSKAPTKTSLAIEIMNANAKLSMADVIPLISAASGVDLRLAKNYYLWAVRKGLAAGTIEKTVKQKTVKIATVVKKAGKAFAAKKAKEAKPVATKTNAVKAIKEANLKRMQEVAAKNKRSFDGARGAKLDPKVQRDELAAYEAELDSFAVPKFLSKSQVNALV